MMMGPLCFFCDPRRSLLTPLPPDVELDELLQAASPLVILASAMHIPNKRPTEAGGTYAGVCRVGSGQAIAQCPWAPQL